jgi:hypothetical protein
MNASLSNSAVFQENIATFFPTEPKVYSLNNRVSRVRINHPTSQWVEKLRERFNEITSLPRGWDGYSALPVSFSCAQFAVNLIERLYDPDVPRPSLVPGSDGTVQIEWHRSQFDVEIEVLAPFHVVATRHDNLADTTEELVLDSDFAELAGWVNDLKLSRQGKFASGVKLVDG